MNEALKQRLVGAGVLLILAGLLWPLLFDFDERLVREAPPHAMPPMPAVARADRGDDAAAEPRPTSVADEPAAQSAPPAASGESPAPVAEPVVAAAPQAEQTARPAKPATANSDDGARPSLDAHGVPVAWVVQVGTFSRWSNAEGLRDRLVDKGYKVYIKPVTSVAPGPYKVFVGPVMTADKAKSAANDVRKVFALPDALVLRFKVVD